MNTNHKNCRCTGTGLGFTLVEVLAVVMIMGIAAAVVVPHMLRGGQLSIQAASRSLIGDIIYAQNDAIAQQALRRVVFDVPGNSYRITDGDGTTITISWKGGADTGANYVIDFDLDDRFRQVALAAVDFNDTNFLEFDALGSPTEGGAIDLTTDGSPGVGYRITVAPFTGQVTIAALPGG